MTTTDPLNVMLLDQVTWDLLLDVNGNIAIASAPYALAQSAACACRLVAGEYYYDTTLGVPQWNLLGQTPPLVLIKEYFKLAALSVPGVVAAQVYVNSVGKDRTLTGQVHVTDSNGVTTVAGF